MKTSSREIFSKYTDASTFSKIVEMQTLGQMWAHSVQEYGSLEAVVYDGVSYSFNEMDKLVGGFRTLITKADVEGNKVAVFGSNSAWLVKAILAVCTLGRTAIIVPPHLPSEKVVGICKLMGIGVLVSEKDLSAECSASGVCYIDIKAEDGSYTPAKECKPQDGCVVMFTGGTTGASKAVLLSNKAVMQGVINGCYGYKDVFNQKYLLVLPLSHVFGFIRNLLTSLYTGSSILICKDNKDMFKDIAVFNPTILVLVPALADMALRLSLKFKKNMLGDSLKYIICGAATVSPYIVNEYQKYGVTVFPGYGLTETANLVSGNPESLKKPSSVGIMYPGQEYQVVDGELWLKGDNLMTAYLGQPSNGFEDGWFRTGDLVKFDEEGFLYITGRVKELIVLPTGENISPAELETEFNQCAFVQDSQVYEDEVNGRRALVLEIVPRLAELAAIAEDQRGSYITSELEKVNATLPSFKRVSKIIIRSEDFARTPSMKIVRYKKFND